MGIDPDQVCELCGLKRDEHGDVQHEFSTDGILRKKAAPTVPKNISPAVRSVGGDPTTRLTLRLIERLISKGVLEGDDLVHIFGGDDVRTEGEHAREAFGDSAPEGTDGSRWASPPGRDSGGAGEPVDQP